MSRARNALSPVLVRTDYARRTEQLERSREVGHGPGGAQQFKYVNTQPPPGRRMLLSMSIRKCPLLAHSGHP